MPYPDHADAPHIPVLREEAVAALNISDTSVIVDATYGRGGHTRAMVRRLGNGGRLLAIDRDPMAIDQGQREWDQDERVEILHARFSRLQSLLKDRELNGRLTGLLFDFGVSSPQLDDADRGFSFMQDGPLDMRMDISSGVTASEWLDIVEEKELVNVLRNFGEERFARKVAWRIKQYIKQQGHIHTTAELAKLVAATIPGREPGKHPATRTFQAIRIAVNGELEEIDAVLPQAIASLAPKGRLVVISFHSLEDRMVKRFLRDQSRGDPYPPDLPVTQDMLNPVIRLVGKPIRATSEELDKNRRSRSAVMRIAERLA